MKKNGLSRESKQFKISFSYLVAAWDASHSPTYRRHRSHEEIPSCQCTPPCDIPIGISDARASCQGHHDFAIGLHCIQANLCTTTQNSSISLRLRLFEITSIDRRPFPKECSRECLVSESQDKNLGNNTCVQTSARVCLTSSWTEQQLAS
jgi:hypothetical protein